MSMNTPIYDFLLDYSKKNPVRFHMPGHKGSGMLGIEDMDITEINGADFLFEANGIIAQSEKNACALFNTGRTLFSTEGSSLSIKAMLYLCTQKSRRKKVLAGRNAHSSFISACALLGIDIDWIFPESEIDSVCTIKTSPGHIDRLLSEYTDLPDAVYLTSPDYLGNMLDIKEISKVCKKHGVFLVVDNAHGAYLNFLKENLHPIYLGADMCCDSAHKTLPCLTGGGYFHISKSAPLYIKQNAKKAMRLFASTSPSYLIMASLDLCNKALCENFEERLFKSVDQISKVRKHLSSKGFRVLGGEFFEPAKITLVFDSLNGQDVLKSLEDENIFCEYADENVLVAMASPENQKSDFGRLVSVLEKVCKEHKNPDFKNKKIKLSAPKKEMTVRQAMMSDFKTVPIDRANGLVCALPVSICPPCVPLIVSGEVFDPDIIKILKNNGIFDVNVVQC